MTGPTTAERREFSAPERIETARLVLRRPRLDDAAAIFARYASVPEVTHYLSFPRHVSIDQTRAFLDFCDDEWRRWPVGPYLIEHRHDGRLLGGTGLGFESPWCASTGYLLARDAWGQGFATEALAAMVVVARRRRRRPPLRDVPRRPRGVAAGAREGRLRARGRAVPIDVVPEPRRGRAARRALLRAHPRLIGAAAHCTVKRSSASTRPSAERSSTRHAPERAASMV